MVTVREHMALQLAAATALPRAVRNDRAIEELGMSPERHAQVVGSLLERADVEAAWPREVRRLRRIRDEKRRRRRSAAA